MIDYLPPFSCKYEAHDNIKDKQRPRYRVIRTISEVGDATAAVWLSSFRPEFCLFSLLILCGLEEAQGVGREPAAPSPVLLICSAGRHRRQQICGCQLLFISSRRRRYLLLHYAGCTYTAATCFVLLFQFFSFQGKEPLCSRLDLGFISTRTHIYLRVCRQNGSAPCHVLPYSYCSTVRRNNEVPTARTSAAADLLPLLRLIHSNQDFGPREKKFDCCWDGARRRCLQWRALGATLYVV